MKNTTFLLTLAVSAALMVVTSGCKHGGIGKTPIPGTTIVPRPGDNADIGKVNNGPGNNINTQPIAPVPSEPIIKTEPPKVLSQDDMGFGTNNPWQKTWDGPLTPDASVFEKDTVYFELDSAVVRSSEQTKLEDIANFFKTNTNDVLMVEGHCDERGTEQYNMALGDKRALAVREYLANLGVEPARIHTVSFGEAKPVDPGHNETAWSKNRRGVSILMRAGNK